MVPHPRGDGALALLRVHALHHIGHKRLLVIPELLHHIPPQLFRHAQVCLRGGHELHDTADFLSRRVALQGTSQRVFRVFPVCAGRCWSGVRARGRPQTACTVAPRGRLLHAGESCLERREPGRAGQLSHEEHDRVRVGNVQVGRATVIGAAERVKTHHRVAGWPGGPAACPSPTRQE